MKVNNAMCGLLRSCTIDRKQCLDCRHLVAGIKTIQRVVSLVDCFFLFILAHTSLLIVGGAIPDSKYKSSTLVGFGHPVTDRHAWFSPGTRFLA